MSRKTLLLVINVIISMVTSRCCKKHSPTRGLQNKMLLLSFHSIQNVLETEEYHNILAVEAPPPVGSSSGSGVKLRSGYQTASSKHNEAREDGTMRSTIRREDIHSSVSDVYLFPHLFLSSNSMPVMPNSIFDNVTASPHSSDTGPKTYTFENCPSDHEYAGNQRCYDYDSTRATGPSSVYVARVRTS